MARGPRGQGGSRRGPQPGAGQQYPDAKKLTGTIIVMQRVEITEMEQLLTAAA